MKSVIDWLASRKQIASNSVTASVGLLILRVWIGLSMALGHGLAKLTGFSERAAEFADPIGVGSHISLSLTITAEFFCSLALVLGVITRGVLIPLVINMAVAGLVIHSADPFRRKELALIYLAIFVTILFTGPGKYSIDGLFCKKQTR